MQRLAGICLSLLATSVLTACGGGGDGTTAPTTTNSAAQGFYSGTTSGTNRTIAGIVLDDGTFYVVYTGPGGSGIGGVVQGSGSANNGSFTSTNAKDFNLEGLGVVSTTVSASYAAKSSLNGSISYPSLNQTNTFTSTYDNSYEQTPSITQVAGVYSGYSYSANGPQSTSLTVSSSGAISGNTLGCVYTGQAKPHRTGNLFDVTLTYGANCSQSSGSTDTGVAVYDSTSRALLATGVNGARTDGFLFLGTKP